MQNTYNPHTIIFAVCGSKNSGKTTLIEKPVLCMNEKGLEVAVIKHDGHDFECDVPGTDSYRFSKAGAYGTAVFSDKRVFVHKQGARETEKELIRMFPEADVIILEGMKNSTYPKIEIVRSTISEEIVSNPEGRFLIISDLEKDHFDEPVLGFDEIDEITRRALSLGRRGESGESDERMINGG